MIPLPEDQPCECSGPGLCPRYGIEQTEYAWRVCSEQCTPELPCTPEKSRAYRQKWAGQRQRRPRAALPLAGQPISLSLAPARPRTPPSRPPLTGGPGTELKALLTSLGLDSAGGCGCADRAKKMDVWGVADCEEHREEILAWLRREQAKRGWLEKTKAIALAVTTGLAFVLDPLDPAPGLLDEALRRARQKEAT